MEQVYIKIRSVNDAGIAIDYLANRGYRLLANKDAYLTAILIHPEIKIITGTNYNIGFTTNCIENYIDLTSQVFKGRPTIF